MWMACRYFLAPVHLLERDHVVLLLLNHHLTCFAPPTAPEFSHLMLLLPAAPQPTRHMLSDAIMEKGGTGGGGEGQRRERGQGLEGRGEAVLFTSSMQLEEGTYLLAFLSSSCVAVTQQSPQGSWTCSVLRNTLGHGKSQSVTNGRLACHEVCMT